MLNNEEFNQEEIKTDKGQENSIVQEEEYIRVSEWHEERNKYISVIQKEYKQGRFVGCMIGMILSIVTVAGSFLFF